MAVYRLKDGATLLVDHALRDKYLGIAMELRDSSEFPQMPMLEFMERFTQAYRQISDYPLRFDSAEHFVLDLFLDGYIMVLDGTRG
jgi:hypothetical protein